MNSDSRPGSALDEQENTNDPPDTPMADADRKDVEAKVAEPSPTDESSSAINPKEEKSNATLTSNADKSETIADKDKDVANEKPRLSSGEDSSHSVDEKDDVAATSQAITTTAKGNESPVLALKANNSIVAPTVTNTITSTSSTATPSIPTSTITSSAVIPIAGDLKPVEKIESAPDGPFTPKEQEIISTVANIKKESNAPVAVENSSEYTGKKVSMVIKKEPGDESTENSSNSNSNSTIGGKDLNATDASNEIKLPSEIKTESKCGLDLSDTNSKHDDASRSAFEPHIKFNTAANKVPPEQFVKLHNELAKPGEPMKFGLDSPHVSKYPQMAADLSQKYDSKLYADQANKFTENESKDKTNAAEGRQCARRHFIRTEISN